MTREEWKVKLDRFNEKFNHICFEKNGLGWFAAIGFGSVIVIPTVMDWDKVIKSRFVIFVAYFLIGLFLHWLCIPPLREGLRPLEFFLSGIGWPLVIIFGFVVIAAFEWFDLRFNRKIKASYLSVFLLTALTGRPALCEWVASHMGAQTSWLEEYNKADSANDTGGADDESGGSK